MEDKDETKETSDSALGKEIDMNERGLAEGAEDVDAGNIATAMAAAWCPNEEFVKALLEMGISQNAAERGLYFTGNISAEAAAEWIFENIDLPDLHDPFQANLVPKVFLEMTCHFLEDPGNKIDHSLSGFAALKSNTQSPYKMVFVVNDSLKMGVGKIAAQVGHAAVGLYRELVETKGQFTVLLHEWQQEGETKVVLKGENTQALMDLESHAMEQRLPTYLVTDAGRTQVISGSVTVLGLFGERSILNAITGKLKLL